LTGRFNSGNFSQAFIISVGANKPYYILNNPNLNKRLIEVNKFKKKESNK